MNQKTCIRAGDGSLRAIFGELALWAGAPSCQRSPCRGKLSTGQFSSAAPTPIHCSDKKKTTPPGVVFFLELVMGVGPMNLVITNDALYQLSYTSAAPRIIAKTAKECKLFFSRKRSFSKGDRQEGQQKRRSSPRSCTKVPREGENAANLRQVNQRKWRSKAPFLPTVSIPINGYRKWSGVLIDGLNTP